MRQLFRIVCVVIVGACTASGCNNAPPTPPAKPAAAQHAPVEQATSATASESTQTPDLAPMRKALAAAGDEDARVLAIDELAKLGQNARGALDDLVKATSDASSRARWHAARAIGLIGEDAISTMPVLVALLSDPDPVVATQAAAAIGLIRADDDITSLTPAVDKAAYESATKALAAAMVHPDARVRRASLRALTKLQPTVESFAPLLCDQLTDADPSVVLPAINSLADMGKEAVPVLLAALKNPKSRYWATVALTEIGPAAAPAVDQLAAGITTGETEERMQSMLALAAIGEPAAAAGDELVKALESPEGSLRFAAAFALGRLRAKGADAALAKAAADPDPFLASVAVWARARINPSDKALVAAAVETLRKGLAADRPSVQAASISALSDLTGSIDDAEEKLLAGQFVELLGSPDADVRIAAAESLQRQGPLAVDALEQAIGNPELRAIAMELLTSIGPVSKPALDSFIKALSDPNPAHRGDAAVAVAAIGPDAAEAVPQLQEMLQAEDGPPGLRYAAAYALGRIGPAAKPAAAVLRSLTQSPDELLATVAVWAALRIEPGDSTLFETAIPRLRRAVRGDREMVRLEAAVALGDIGPAAETAIPILELVSEEDPQPNVRAAAKQALARIRGGAGSSPGKN